MSRKRRWAERSERALSAGVPPPAATSLSEDRAAPRSEPAAARPIPGSDPRLAALSQVLNRSLLSAGLYKPWKGKRDLYKAIGYPEYPAYEDYRKAYERQDIAGQIIDAPINACWREDPRVVEVRTDEEGPTPTSPSPPTRTTTPPALRTEAREKTPFEKGWDKLAKDLEIYDALARVDRLASIGSYAVLLLGFDGPLDREPQKGSTLYYLTPYSEAGAKIKRLVTKTNDPRYGMPDLYEIQILNPSGNPDGSTRSQLVHWSRLIHVVETPLESRTEGTPRLKRVLNRLYNLETVAGGSCEMFWLGGFPGYNFKLDPEASPSAETLDAIKDEIELYFHGLKRYMRLTGIEAQALQQQIADPSSLVGVLLDLISAGSDTPRGILIDTGGGELASSQQSARWIKKIEGRQNKHCTKFLTDTIKRIGEYGTLSVPERFEIQWPDALPRGEREKAEIGEIRARALAEWLSATGGPEQISLEHFLIQCWGLSEELAAEIVADAEPIPEPPEPVIVPSPGAGGNGDGGDPDDPAARDRGRPTFPDRETPRSGDGQAGGQAPNRLQRLLDRSRESTTQGRIARLEAEIAALKARR